MENGIQLWNKDELGQYWLLFPNKHGLTKIQIKEIFSSFANIRNIRVAGNERGLHFVQFSSLAEVEKVVAGLANHPTIKFLPIRPKKKDNQNSNAMPKNKENDNTKHSSPNEERNFFPRKYLNSNNATTSKKSNNCAECTFHKTNSIDQTKPTSSINSQDDFSAKSNSSTSGNNFLTNKKDMLGKKLLKDYAHSQTSLKSDTENSSITNVVCPESKALELLKMRGINATNFSYPKSLSNNAHIPIDDSKENVPDLITNSKFKSFQEPNKKTVDAEEIIVANIPKDYGSAYILHLFEKFQPIAISYVNKLPTTDIQYCHVYFKTVKDSIIVEKMFDRYILAGKKLVVLRPCRIIEESVR